MAKIIEIYLMITIILFCFAFVCVLWIIYNISVIRKANLESRRIKKLQSRNDHLYDYRLKILYKDRGLYEKLPSYDEMLESNKPLEDRFWLQ